ncbi:unnamed protein product, partial [Porites evermanni]
HFFTEDESASGELSGNESKESSESSQVVTINPEDDDKCEPNPCRNGGTCVSNYNYIDGYVCECADDFGGITCGELKCRITLPRFSSPQCLIKRELSRHIKKTLIRLTSASDNRYSKSEDLMVPTLSKKGAASFVQSASTDPFTIEWYMKMTDNADINKDLESHFTLKDPRFHETPTLIDFAVVFEAFYKHHRKRSAMSALKLVPAVEENFFKDRCFADQRVAGANPFQLWRVTNKEGENGIQWQDLFDEKLNKDFKWAETFEAALGTGDKDALEKAIENGQVYVNIYPALDGVKMPQALLHDVKFNHTVVQMTSPIAFFVVSEAELGIKRLNPVAIQMDYTPDSKVYTPLDGKNWFLAKSFVQRADFNTLHLIEKRLKTHLYLDAPCTLSEKYFSEYHPVYQLLRQHCRAALETNKLFEIKLFGKSAPVYKVLSVDYSSALEMLNKEYENMIFDDLDLKKDLKKRGVDDPEKLPFYPYRDDGLLLYAQLDDFVDAYVDAYYEDDQEVESDNELQELVNELSANGTGDFGGMGMVQKFPAIIESKATLRKVLTTLMWAFTGRHAATTYPILEYGGFLPNAPHRMFADQDGNEAFSNLMFGNKAVALEIAELSSNLAGIHLDQLLDYSSKIEGKKGIEVVEKHHKQLESLTKEILKANDQRVVQGFLPYPYFLPAYVTNSPST